MLSRVFTTDDTTLYSTWCREEGGIVILFVPGVGEVRMSYDKAAEIAEDLKDKVNYGRWDAIEKDHAKGRAI